MTKDELNEFLENCPKLYHMAELGSWPSIRERGLLSTSAILDLYGIQGQARKAIEERRRPESVTVRGAGLPDIVIRDQIPMSDDALRKCLQDGLQPQDWYRLLNNRVFFWVSKDRLMRLLGARAYRDKAHDIIELDTAPIVEGFAKNIWLCPINSGSTIMNPVPRGKATFARIENYPYDDWSKRRGKQERIVELAIDHSVPNLRDFVTGVSQVKGDKVIKTYSL